MPPPPTGHPPWPSSLRFVGAAVVGLASSAYTPKNTAQLLIPTVLIAWLALAHQNKHLLGSPPLNTPTSQRTPPSAALNFISRLMFVSWIALIVRVLMPPNLLATALLALYTTTFLDPPDTVKLARD